MPRKSNTPKKSLSRKEKFKRAKFGGYINADLDKSKGEQFESWLVDNPPNPLHWLDALVTEDYSFGFHYDEQKEACISKMTYVDTSTWKTWTLTAFHIDLEKSLMLLIFKHEMLLGRDWSEFTEATDDRQIYG